MLAAPFSIYIHVPFCQHRCAYCDFNTYAGQEGLIPAYVQALCQEIEFIARSASERLPVHTVFFGGGTPSLLPIVELNRVFTTLARAFNLLPYAEITLEANPGTLSAEYLVRLRELGVTRLSLGMQSAHPDDLRLLERQHQLDEVGQSVKWARKAGFENVNLDLIFGIPYQTLDRWKRTLEMALSLHPEHFSLYALTLEHGTPFAHWVGRGLLPEPDPDLAADMYELASESLDRSGFVQYEISNWALRSKGSPSKSCQHNLQYWRSLPYLGIGAGAHGFVAGVRTVDFLTPRVYVERLKEPVVTLPFPRTPATMEMNPVSQADGMSEFMIMGLRLVEEGVSEAEFQKRFGKSLMVIYGKAIDRLVHLDLLEWAGEKRGVLRLTHRGRLLGNQVFREFV